MTTFQQLLESHTSILGTIYKTADYHVFLDKAPFKERGTRYPAGIYVYKHTSAVPVNSKPMDTLEDAIELCETSQVRYEERMAEKKAKEEAEAKAKAARPADAATPRQVDYIMDLLAQGRREEGGYYYGPTDRAGIEAMTRRDASAYIDSLKGNY